MKLSMRNWVSIATVVLIVLLLFLTRHELVRAWELLGKVNLWILLLFIPLVVASYLVSGEMIFSFLRQKHLIKHLSIWQQMRMSLEMNFVNHALPSGGVSGLSYMTWRMKNIGVTTSKAATAQMVRLATGLLSFVTLLLIAVVAITIDGGVNRWIILISSTLAASMIGVIVAGVYFLKDKKRVHTAAKWVTETANKLVGFVSRKKRKKVLDRVRVEGFFGELHEDYNDITKDKRLLLKPYLWGIAFSCLDVAMYVVAFWALGSVVNPAAILIAYGIATVAGFLVVTPGGSGAYEALMVAFLVFSGINQGVAIAGVLLTRVLILVVILVLGYAFYQHALVKYGKPRTDT